MTKITLSLAFVLLGGIISNVATAEGVVLIGIHGLANKPEKDTLSMWWTMAINDGLHRNCAGKKIDDQFELVYWRDLRYEKPDPDPEPYTAFNEDVEASTLKSEPAANLRHAFTEIVGTVVEVSDGATEGGPFDKLKKTVMSKYASDLNDYYYGNHKITFGEFKDQPTQGTIRAKLSETLVANKDNRIVLIAHSMGSIIAYDVLLDLEEAGSDIKIEHFITIGSPLGISVVKDQIKIERELQGRKLTDPKVPVAIQTSWLNYADPKDPVAVDTELQKDFENTGSIIFTDVKVVNDYSFETDEGKLVFNAHKSYGYLRTDEFSDFLCSIL